VTNKGSRNVVYQMLTGNPPLQHQILLQLLRKFSEVSYVAEIYARGSLVAIESQGQGGKLRHRSDFDRMSDVDLVLVIDPEHFGTLLLAINVIMTECFGAILPGWYDKIVPNFGGVGLVYLLAHEGRLIQADIYITPRITKNFRQLQQKCLLYRRAQPLKKVGKTRVTRVIRSFADTQNSATADFVAGAVLAFLINKRIARRQFFLCFDETNMFYGTARQLLRRKFDPARLGYGWYYFAPRVGKVERGRQFVSRLMELMASAGVDKPETLSRNFAFLNEVMAECFPEEFAGMQEAIELLSNYFQAYSLGVC